MVVAKRLGRQPFFAEFVVIKFLQGMRFKLLEQDFSQYTKVLVEITAVAGVGGLLDGIFHVSLQPVFVPFAKSHRHRIAPALCADFVGLLLQDCDCLLPRVAAGGCASGLTGFVVDSGG